MKKISGGDIMMGIWLTSKDSGSVSSKDGVGNVKDKSWSHTVGVWSDI